MTERAPVMLVGGDGSVAAAVQQAATATKDCRLERFENLTQAASRLELGGVALVIVYLAHPEQAASAVAFVQKATKSSERVAIVFLLENEDAALTLRLLKQGAAEVLCRPFDLNRLAYLVDLLTIRARCGKPKEPTVFDGEAEVDVDGAFLAYSPAMRALTEQVELVAKLSSTVLITGETGTGKTHLAQVIHQLSPRRNEPLLTVNCGALSPALLESEMFGHVRGAFTGAHRDYPGKFVQAGEGTLLLDEIEAMPLTSQASLLRAVEQRVFEPVGSGRSRRLGARLIVASNACLEEEVQAQRFRSDLFYRINVFRFHIPPLRERPEDVAPLAERLLAIFAARHGLEPVAFSRVAMDLLEAHDWPGNVRELSNLVERVLVLRAGSVVDAKNLYDLLEPGKAASSSGRKAAVSLAEARSMGERQRIIDTLRNNNHNRTDTARELGISRTALYKKLHKHGFV